MSILVFSVFMFFCNPYSWSLIFAACFYVMCVCLLVCVLVPSWALGPSHTSFGPEASPCFMSGLRPILILTLGPRPILCVCMLCYVCVPPTLLCSSFLWSHVCLVFYVILVCLFVLFLMWVMCGYVLYSCMFAWIFCVCFCKSYVVVCLCESCITIYVFGINAHFLVVCLCLVINFLVEWSSWCKFLILEWSVCV